MTHDDWPYQPGELKVLPVSGGYHRIVDGRGANVMTLFAADPRRAAAAAGLLVDAARLLWVDATVRASAARIDAILADLESPVVFDDRHGAELTGLDPANPPTPAPCPAAELDALDRRLLGWSGNTVWSEPGVLA